MFRWHFRCFALFIVSVAVLIASPSGQAGQSDLNSLRSKADSGDAAAQYDLGYAYEYGHLDLDKDLKQAAVWFRKSADQGSAAAQNHLGHFYENGLGGLPQDYTQAMYWFRKSSEQDDPYSQYSLGVMYEAGWGVPKDPAQAAYWYNRAVTNFPKVAEREDNAKVSMGDLYASGRGGLPKDEAKAIEWYRKAADAGNASGQAKLGIRYRDGIGITKDEAQARALFEKAAAQGDSFGERLLAYMYLNGEGGLAKDTAQAIAWFRKAADQDDTFAQTALASLYEYGSGVPQDEAQAVSWYLRAAEHGNRGALNSVAWLYVTSTDPNVRNPQKALEFALKAVEADPRDFVLDTLAESYFATGNFQKAVETEQKAVVAAAPSAKIGYEKQIERYRAAAAHPVTSPLGHWHGVWKSQGTIYIAELELLSKVPGEVDGKIRWTLNAADKPELKDKIGQSATEYVHGFYDTKKNDIEFSGFKKDDTTNLIDLDNYRMQLGDYGDILYGATANHGSWTGHFSLRRVPTRPAGPARPLAGTYRLYTLTEPAHTASPDYITITRKAPPSIAVQGNDFTGEGSFVDASGSYDWKYTGGSSGKTEIVSNPDGTLTLHVIWPTGQLWSVAIFLPGRTDPYNPPKTKTPAPKTASPRKPVPAKAVSPSSD